MKEYWQLALDYPVRPYPRYGYGKPAHPQLHRILDRGRSQYAALLTSFLTHREKMLRIPVEYSESVEACWDCGWLPGLDIVSLYCLIGIYRPARYIEIGSGASTKLVRRAVQDFGLPTHVTSIDPYPREDVDTICDEVIRSPLEEVDLAVFDKLKANDVVFADGSHRSLMNSDATVLFLDVLPRLTEGILLGCHDICLPEDYPPEYVERFYSEQYLLAAYLLADGVRFRVILPNWFVSRDAELGGVLAPLWDNPMLDRIHRHGSIFWIETSNDPSP